MGTNKPETNQDVISKDLCTHSVVGIFLTTPEEILWSVLLVNTDTEIKKILKLEPSYTLKVS